MPSWPGEAGPAAQAPPSAEGQEPAQGTHKVSPPTARRANIPQVTSAAFLAAPHVQTPLRLGNKCAFSSLVQLPRYTGNSAFQDKWMEELQNMMSAC